MDDKNTKSIPYLAARLQMCRSADKTVNEDMSAMDDRFTGDFSEHNYIDKKVLEGCIDILGEPSVEEMKPYIEQLLREFTDKLYGEYLKHYGWSESSLTTALALNLEPVGLKNYATEIAEELALELNRDNIVVDPDFDIDDGKITAYLETRFDADRKFGAHTADRDDEWLNLYAEYAPKNGELTMTYFISNEDKSTDYKYVPTEKEKQLVIGMMEDECQKQNGCSLAELAEQNAENTMGEMA